MSESASTGGARILLDGVTKRYAAQAEPAVDDITMEIPAGEIVMLVGPSGCGKTTTMKMINRLIEPTSGRSTATATHANCPAANSSASGWRGHSPPTRRCC